MHCVHFPPFLSETYTPPSSSSSTSIAKPKGRPHQARASSIKGLLAPSRWSSFHSGERYHTFVVSLVACSYVFLKSTLGIYYWNSPLRCLSYAVGSSPTSIPCNEHVRCQVCVGRKG